MKYVTTSASDLVAFRCRLKQRPTFYWYVCMHETDVARLLYPQASQALSLPYMHNVAICRSLKCTQLHHLASIGAQWSGLRPMPDKTRFFMSCHTRQLEILHVHIKPYSRQLPLMQTMPLMKMPDNWSYCLTAFYCHCVCHKSKCWLQL